MHADEQRISGILLLYNKNLKLLTQGYKTTTIVTFRNKNLTKLKFDIRLQIEEAVELSKKKKNHDQKYG